MYTIWGRSNCVWCERAKDILEDNNLEYDYIELTPNNLEIFTKLTHGAKTVPQIFDPYSQLIGGHDDLLEFIDEVIKA